MTRDEIRGLMGGYATGSLTEAERNALFNAALEDQELFDELAREHAIKGAIDQPGARERLLSALQPKPRFNSLWIWATAGAAAAAVVVIGVLLIRSSREPQQIAKVETPKVETPSVPQPSGQATGQTHPEPPQVNREAPKPAAPETVVQPRLQMKRKVAPVPAPEPVPAQTEAAAKKTDSDIAQAPPALPAGVAGGVTGSGGGRGGGGGGGRGGRAVPQSLAAPMAAAPPPPARPLPARFAFDYSVTAGGALRIVPAANGFLSTYCDNGAAGAALFFNGPLQAGAAAEIPLPADCVTARVVFSAKETPVDLLNFSAPVDPPSGTKSDPNPSPDSSLQALIPVKR